MNANYSIVSAESVSFTKAPTVAIAGETGSGKTESAMRLASGYVGAQGKFVVIDTEEKRALYKKNRYKFDWMDLQPPFTPENYAKALEAAKGYAAVIVDSGSHEYTGEGGMQDMQAEDLERMSKGDSDKMAKLTAPAWKRAKLEHKKLMTKLIRYPTLLIVCLRAEPKIKFVKDEKGKTQIVDAGYQPICERMFGYEMLVFAMVHADNPGVPQHVKKLEPELEPIFPAGEQITEATGQRLAAWAKGSAASQQAGIPDEHNRNPLGNDYITADQHIVIMDELKGVPNGEERLRHHAQVERLTMLPRTHYERALDWIKRAKSA